MNYMNVFSTFKALKQFGVCAVFYFMQYFLKNNQNSLTVSQSCLQRCLQTSEPATFQPSLIPRASNTDALLCPLASHTDAEGTL